MCNSHSLRVIYVLCSCIDIFNLVGFVLSLCTLHVVWSSGYKTSNFSRSLHEVEVSTFMYSRVDFELLCERGLRGHGRAIERHSLRRLFCTRHKDPKPSLFGIVLNRGGRPKKNTQPVTVRPPSPPS